MAKDQPILSLGGIGKPAGMVQAHLKAEQDREAAIRSVRSTQVDEVFVKAAAARPEAIRIVAEGDSWFAYPKGAIWFGKPSNVVDHLKDMDTSVDLIIHDLSSNGDEAVAMLAGSAKLNLLKRVADHEYDILLFSGGGNDIVGAYDFEYFLNEYQDGYGVQECIRHDRFRRRLDQVRHAYCDLIELTGDYSKNKALRIVTHTYDVAPPSPQGAEFFGGLLKIDGAKSWMYPYLMRKGIENAQLQLGIVKYILEAFRDMLMSLAMSEAYKDRFWVVNTHGLIEKDEWLNEIHPNSSGFKRVAKKILSEGIMPLSLKPAALPRVAAARAAAAVAAVAAVTGESGMTRTEDLGEEGVAITKGRRGVKGGGGKKRKSGKARLSNGDGSGVKSVLGSSSAAARTRVTSRSLKE